jgi:hypothetical protein
MMFDEYASPFVDRVLDRSSETEGERGSDLFEGLVKKRKRAFRRMHFYDLNGKYLGAWRRWQSGWHIRLIKRSDYKRIVAAGGGAKPDQFKKQSVRKMVESLAKHSRLVTVQRLNPQKKFLKNLFEKAKKANKEHAAYILLDYPNATLTFRIAKVVNQTPTDVDISLGTVSKMRTLPPPDGDVAVQVIGTVHTHYFRDPLINTSSTRQGKTIRSNVKRIHYGVSKLDMNSAKDHGIVVHAFDSRYIHKALPSGRKLNKQSKDQNVLVHALWLFGFAPGPRI